MLSATISTDFPQCVARQVARKTAQLYSGFKPGADNPGGRFSKDPVTYRVRRAIIETMILLPLKGALLINFRHEERQNNCQIHSQVGPLWSHDQLCRKQRLNPVGQEG